MTDNESYTVDPDVRAITSHHWELKDGEPTYSKTPLPDGPIFVADAFDKAGVVGWTVKKIIADSNGNMTVEFIPVGPKSDEAD